MVRLLLLIPTASALLALCIVSLIWAAPIPAQLQGQVPASFVNPRDAMRSAIGSIQVKPETIDAEIMDQMSDLLKSAPLEDEPFTLAALRQNAIGRLNEAQQFVAIARLRNPRSREALLLSVDVALAVEDIPTAVANLETLTRLNPAQRAIFDQSLVALAIYPGTQKATLASINDDTVKRTVLGGLARSGAEPTLLIRAKNEMGATSQIEADRGTINALTQTYIAAGNYAGAYRVWSDFIALKSDQATEVRDPDFKRGLPPPFGWDIPSGSDAFVAPTVSGLEGKAYGRRSANLARQFLVLPPGRFKLAIDVAQPSELIEVIVRCVAGPVAPFVAVRLTEAGIREADFEVPANCAAQILDVNARANDPPAAQTFELHSITVTRGGL